MRYIKKRLVSPFSEAAMQAQATTLPSHYLTDKIVHFGSWGNNFLLHTFPVTLVKDNLGCRTFVTRLCCRWWVVYILWYICSWSPSQLVDCDPFTPALWKLLTMSQTYLGFFFPSQLSKCHQLLFPCWPVWCLVISTLVWLLAFSVLSKLLYLLCSMLVHWLGFQIFPLFLIFKMTFLWSSTLVYLFKQLQRQTLSSAANPSYCK